MCIVPNDGAEFFREKSHQHDFYHVARNERKQNRDYGFLKCRLRHEHKSDNAAREHDHALKNRRQTNNKVLLFL